MYKNALRNFAKFTEKHLSQAQPCSFIKNRLQHRCFPVKFLKFLRTSFFTEHLLWLLWLVEMLRLHINVLLMFGLGQKLYQDILVGVYVNVTLFSREQCYRKYMEKKINQPDELAFFLTAVFLQYLQTCLLYKSQANQYKTVYKVREKIFQIQRFLKLFFVSHIISYV